MLVSFTKSKVSVNSFNFSQISKSMNCKNISGNTFVSLEIAPTVRICICKKEQRDAHFLIISKITSSSSQLNAFFHYKFSQTYSFHKREVWNYIYYHSLICIHFLRPNKIIVAFIFMPCNNKLLSSQLAFLCLLEFHLNAYVLFCNFFSHYLSKHLFLNPIHFSFIIHKHHFPLYPIIKNFLCHTKKTAKFSKISQYEAHYTDTEQMRSKYVKKYHPQTTNKSEDKIKKYIFLNTFILQMLPSRARLNRTTEPLSPPRFEALTDNHTGSCTLMIGTKHLSCI